MKNEIFRAYDIRGIVPDDINEETSYIFGKSFGTYVQKYFNKSTVLVGHDNRLSSDMIHDNLIKGIIEVGANVIDLGLVTTPMFYYARYYLNNYVGVMITASHNPKEYNGFKISFNELGNALGDEIQNFKDFVNLKEYNNSLNYGTISKYDIREKYIDNMINSLKISGKKLKIVFDCGNGTGSIIIKEILDKLNMEYDLLYCESNGNFPNHHPDPAVNKNLIDLQKRVVELNYDLGVAVDADCDRVRVVDERGNIIDSDILMSILYKYMNNNLKVRKAVYDVKCSKSLIDTLESLNIEGIMWRTGNSYLNRKFHEEHLDFSGEYSGHFYFSDNYFGYDDGIYAGLRVVEMLSNCAKSLSTLVNEIPKYYASEEMIIKSTDTEKYNVVNNIKKYVIDKKYNYCDIDGIRVLFNDGWALVRVSNTGPNLTVRFEGNTPERLEKIKQEFLNLLK